MEGSVSPDYTGAVLSSVTSCPRGPTPFSCFAFQEVGSRKPIRHMRQNTTITSGTSSECYPVRHQRLSQLVSGTLSISVVAEQDLPSRRSRPHHGRSASSDTCRGRKGQEQRFQTKPRKGWVRALMAHGSCMVNCNCCMAGCTCNAQAYHIRRIGSSGVRPLLPGWHWNDN
jgi:hypothetical protein